MIVLLLQRGTVDSSEFTLALMRGVQYLVENLSQRPQHPVLSAVTRNAVSKSYADLITAQLDRDRVPAMLQHAATLISPCVVRYLKLCQQEEAIVQVMITLL